MVKTTQKKSVWETLSALGWPIGLGLAASVAFYGLIHAGLIRHPLVLRYFAGHPVEYVETALVFVGLAALLIKLIQVLSQYGTLSRIDLALEHEDRPYSVDRISDLRQQLSQIPSRVRDTYLGNRLATALEYLRRSGTADGLDDELKYLADLDAARQHESYALVRIVIWATPMLGFLGTVIGITLALGDLSPESLVKTPEVAMQGLLAGLSVAFDTTALALSLSIVLMFAQFLTNRLETELLDAVDSRTTEQLVGTFQRRPVSDTPQLAALQRMSEQVIRTTETLVHRQVELWNQSLDVVRNDWSTQTQLTADQLKQQVAETLSQAVQQHATLLHDLEDDSRNRSHATHRQLVASLNEQNEVLQMQQQKMAEQGDTLIKVVNAAGEVIQLEAALNQNLNALAGSRNFEDLVMSLSAAIHLLSARLGTADMVNSTNSQTAARKGQAA